ncbi:MAG TPA: zinc chelation protein SecC [Oceanospirillaceae bacterium]|nr:zinc chelation protein SecC [Oceanospirillaceae bacterium]
MNCYCKSDLLFANCCQPFIEGRQVAATAEQLMRSRYSAFCLHNEPYLKLTWHPTTRPEAIDFDEQQHWLGLKIISSHDGGVGDSVGQVEFVARYKIHGRAYRLHENSDFVMQNGSWQYTQGTLL